MKSVGEVMSIGRSFEEALQKALRMTGIGAPGLAGDDSLCGKGLGNIADALRRPTDRRVFIICRALREGWTVEKIHRLTKIDKWFLNKIRNVMDCERELRNVKGNADFVSLGAVLETGKSVTTKSKALSADVVIDSGAAGKNGYGLMHIIEERLEKDSRNENEIAAICFLVLESIRGGVIVRDISVKNTTGEDTGRYSLEKDGVIVIVSKMRFGKNEKFVITGFESRREKTKAADAVQTVIAQYGYAPEFSYFRTQVGAAVASLSLSRSAPEKSSTAVKASVLRPPFPVPSLSKDLLAKAKRLGFSDARIGAFTGMTEREVRSLREELRIKPAVKQIDTLAAEYPAKTNYLYMTYGSAGSGAADDVSPAGRGGRVLGSGAYRIGSSVEFDWCCVNAVETARKLGRYSIMVNCNPETVSTDYDVCDRLYFEELTLERILDIYERERPDGVILSMGGQIPNNLATKLYAAGAVIYGTTPQSIDSAEDRHKFSALLDELGIEQPEWKELTGMASAKAFAAQVGYPVLIRPSYVLSGAAMNVAWDDGSLEKFLGLASDVSPEHPVVISKFVENSKEIEIDAVARRGKILFHAITEHVENAGVHSGDATVVLPAQRLYIETIRKIRRTAERIAAALDITGPFNIQFLAQRNKVKVIECNLRASRSFPFCSKISRVNMIDIAVRAMLGTVTGAEGPGSPLTEPVQKTAASALDLPWVGVKAAQFSYSRLHGADPVSGVEMASTGEVGCIGSDLSDAFLKSILSVGYRIPKKRILLSTGPIEDKLSFLDSARKLASMGYELYGSRGTAKFLSANGVSVTALNWPLESKEPNIASFIRRRDIDMIINIPKNNRETELKNDYLIRRMAVDFDIPLFTNVKVAREFIDALAWEREKGLEIKAWEEYR
jgi:carbamoylphosphate synthase large subunit